MPYIREGRKCRSEGCCVLTQKYGKPESPTHTDKPDTNYPHLWKELLYIVFFFPSSVGLFIYDVYSHFVLRRPKRPTWNRSTSMTVAMLHTVRSLLRKNSLSLWRHVLAIPYKMSSPALTKFHEASFTAKKLNLPGILKKHDAFEDGSREITAHWLFPEIDTDNEENNKIILYFHGGGYCVKDWKAFITLTERLSKSTNLPIYCVSYRLAPETRFPGALIDAVQSYFHLIKYYRFDPKKIIVAGDSAGGGLALSLMIYLRDHGFPLPCSSLLLSPWIDLTYNHQSWLDAAAHDVLPPRPDFEALMNPARFYLGASQYHKLCKHPYASPLFANTLECLPPILIQYGSKEVMSDEIRTFIKRLRTCRYTVFRSEEYEDMIHVFQAFPFAKTEIAFKSIETWTGSYFSSNSKKIKGEYFY